MCSACGATFPDDAAFCSHCGSPTGPPDDAARIAALEEQVQELNAALHQRPPTPPPAPFRWHTVSSQDKWAVTWGVWGRTILINIIVFFALAILLGGLGVLASL